ncbi:MAG: rhodanese-like domain-containing protein [Opitutus sp.]|nr:rhodanese-like domain-containing protein [Opitutus sp.]MCS6299778.1 rhodanese-like domain-containing protein [Opitutus sp.]
MFGVIVLGSTVLPLLVSCFLKQSNHYSLGHWSINELSATDLSLAQSSTLIVDARAFADYQKGHIAAALSLSPERWDESLGDFLSAWSPERPVVVYCGGQACGLSKDVALKILSDLPDAKVFVLKGGYPAWQTYQAQKNPAAL